MDEWHKNIITTLLGIGVGSILTLVAQYFSNRQAANIALMHDRRTAYDLCRLFIVSIALESDRLTAKHIADFGLSMRAYKFVLNKQDREYIDTLVDKAYAIQLSLQRNTDDKYDLWKWFGEQLEGLNGQLSIDERFAKYLSI